MFFSHFVFPLRKQIKVLYKKIAEKANEASTVSEVEEENEAKTK